MPEIIDIVAIHGRAAEGTGVSRPFRCEGIDGRDYFVKLNNVGYECLVKEWEAGRLALEMGLPAASVHQVRIPAELIKGHREYETDLGQGLAFGSLKVKATDRLAFEFIQHEDTDTLSRILLFDWWIKNQDRTLTPTGGNPNLLWESSPGRVVMIDHDNAFDPAFHAVEFWAFHALQNHRSTWAIERRIEMVSWLEGGLARLDDIWVEIPEEWLVDFYEDPRCKLDKRRLRETIHL